MEVYPQKMDGTHHIMRYVHDKGVPSIFSGFTMYLHPQKNDYSHFLKLFGKEVLRKV